MRLSLLLASTLLGLSAFAQPVVEPQYFPVTNTRIEEVWDDQCDSMAIPTSGPNQVWDYSSVWYNIADTTNFVTYHPDSTPHVALFPDANQSGFLSGIPVVGLDSMWNYMRFDTNGVWGVGYYSERVNLPGPLNVLDEELQMLSPVHYLDYKQDTGVFEGYTNVGGIVPAYMIRYMWKTFECTGYGTLMTPDATWDNVLLVREVLDLRDSMFVDPFSTGTYTFQQAIDINTIRYHFLRNNTFATAELMQLNADAADTEVLYAWYALPADFGSIAGTVLDTNGSPVTAGEMLLYRENSNFARNDILATTDLDMNGNYQFDSIPYGIYRIAARADSLLYPNSLTTYHGDTTNWLDCDTIITTDSIYDGMVINLQYHSPVNGQGNMQGTVYLDLSFTRSNDPIPGIDVVVRRNPSGVSTVGNITDGGGGFNSTYLDPGNYTIFVDVPGLHMAGSYDATITAGESFANLDFIIGLDSIYPVYDPAGLEEYATDEHESIGKVFPNPAKGQQTVAFTLHQASDVKVRLLDASGRLISEVFDGQLEKGAYAHTFSEADFPNRGLYLVEFVTSGGHQTLKLLRE